MRSVKISNKQELSLRATSGSVEVTAASDASLTAKVSVSFPKDPYHMTECGGVIGGVATCTCVDGLGHTKQCMTSDPTIECCNDGSTGEVQVAWSATAPKCPELCICSSTVANCPCF